MDYGDIVGDIREENITQRMISQKKVAKWQKIGLLEGLSGKKKTHMARLLENQAKQVLKESSATSDIQGFQAVAFPMVRRVFGQLLAQEIVSVQPMALPAGLLFWLDFTYGTAKAGAGQAGRDWATGKSVYGDPVSPLTGGAAGSGGHYNMHHSYTQFEATGTLPIQTSGAVTLWSELDYDFTLSSSLAGGMVYKLTVDFDEDATITNVDTTNVKSFAVSGANASLGASFVALPRFNSFNATTNVLTLYYSGSSTAAGGPNSGSNVTVSYVKKAPHAATTSGTTLNPAFEYAFDGTDHIPELDILIKNMPVVANDRKLKAKWTPELAQDLNAYHTLDAEAELTQILADHVAVDIDSEILSDLTQNARANGTVKYWDARSGFFTDPDTGAPQVPAPSFTGNVEEWYRTIMIRINAISNEIHRRNLRAGANFLVTSPDVCTILESIVQWRPVMSGDPSETKYSMGVEKAGAVGRYTVYKAPFFYRNQVLVGYKGDEWLSTGYVYAPYIPLIVTPTIYDPDNFTPRKAVMTRYAKQVVRADFYGVLIIKGMPA